MQHQERIGPLEVDHFDPRKKKHLIQEYKNLFPASRQANGKKSDHWPTKEEMRAGCRFLNPCEEMDYGEQIVEDPQTHELIGLNRAAVWHIRICGLNAPLVVQERRKRASHGATIKKTIFVMRKHDYQSLTELVAKYREEVALMIPEIPFATAAS